MSVWLGVAASLRALLLGTCRGGGGDGGIITLGREFVEGREGGGVGRGGDIFHDLVGHFLDWRGTDWGVTLLVGIEVRMEILGLRFHVWRQWIKAGIDFSLVAMPYSYIAL